MGRRASIAHLDGHVGGPETLPDRLALRDRCLARPRRAGAVCGAASVPGRWSARDAPALPPAAPPLPVPASPAPFPVPPLRPRFPPAPSLAFPPPPCLPPPPPAPRPRAGGGARR